jgi:hypothetical protein
LTRVIIEGVEIEIAPDNHAEPDSDERSYVGVGFFVLGLVGILVYLRFGG